MNLSYLSVAKRNIAIFCITPLLLANFQPDQHPQSQKDAASSTDGLLDDASTDDGASASSVEILPVSNAGPNTKKQEIAPQFNVVPAGIRLKVFLNEELSSKLARPRDIIEVTVLEDVIVEDTVVIPAGTPGFGEVLFANDKGGFGRAGLLDVRLNYLVYKDTEIPLHGRFRQEGKNNNGITVATWLAVGIFSGFITGKEGIMPQGQEFNTRVIADTKVPITYSAATEAYEESDGEHSEQGSSSSNDPILQPITDLHLDESPQSQLPIGSQANDKKVTNQAKENSTIKDKRE